jgi:hypothetical protein
MRVESEVRVGTDRPSALHPRGASPRDARDEPRFRPRRLCRRRRDEAWNLLRENRGHHAQHEDVIIFPMLEERAPGETAGLMHDHVVIHELEVAMTELLDRLSAETDPDLRQLLGREFHRSMQHYTAVCLSHFDDEERHLMPRLWALYDDALEAAFGPITATVDAEEREFTMAHMSEALDPQELVALRARMVH